MKNISILGSTGSIGLQTLEVIKSNKSQFKVKGLACNSNIKLLKRQIEEFNPEVVSVFDEDRADILRKQLNINVLSGMNGLIELARLDSADTILNSLVGSVGIKPTLAAIKAKKNIVMANKETLVAAGEIIIELAKKNGIELKPIDSEHSAIFQCLNGQEKKDIKRLILTCSGGPFLCKKMQEMKNLKVTDALKHPRWKMGNKILIDSATLMNKGFEVIEANMLFGVDYDKIDVVVHPQTIIHSLVEFKDTSVIAQLGLPDMKIAIQYALSHPKRLKSNLKSLDLVKVSQLNFRKPNVKRFPCLQYAYEAGRTGGTMPCVMSAADEIAVKAFLDERIGFMDIAQLIKKKMSNHKTIKNPELDDILYLDKKIKNEMIKELY